MTADVAVEALRLLTEICPLPLIGVDKRGRIDLWNAASASTFGWGEEEVAGRKPPSELGAVIDPGRSSVRAKNGNDLEIESRVEKRKDGGLLIAVRDLSAAVAQERERLNERLSLLEREQEADMKLKAESRFRELLEAAPDAIIEADEDGRIVLLNRVTEKLFGYSREELLGRNVDTLLPPDMMDRHKEHRERYWANPTVRPMGFGYSLKACRKDGSEFPAEISLSPVHNETGFRVTAIIRDVTAQKKAEEEIRLANQRLELQNREAERANALKSEFLASMSHELRTPLHTILGFTELLREEIEDSLNEKQKRYIQHVHRDSVHLLELINDILDLSKIESGRLDLRIESVDAAEVAAETAAGMQTAAAAKNISIENTISQPVYVLADRVRLREILTNLMSNAIKFTPGGGWVRMECPREGDEGVELTVADSGIGIAPEDQQVIFDKFRQVGSTTKGVREGTGLGLSIVKQLVEMHGGVIRVESAPGCGSRFSVTLPADSSRLREKPLVLIVEDEPSARELLCSYLDPQGVRTELAATAEEGLDKARRVRPDAVILDVLLPGRTGWHVLEELQADPGTSSIPVFMTSVLDFDRGATARGAMGYLQKPLTKEKLLRALREHIPDRFGNI